MSITARADPLGERAVLITFSGGTLLTRNNRVHALDTVLQQSCKEAGIIETVPGLESLLLIIDPAAFDEARLRRVLSEPATLPEVPAAGREVEVPVEYGGDSGPDLQKISGEAGIAPAQAIGLHAAATYSVLFVGFLPGFPYLWGTPSVLQRPRLATPRVRVMRGSVGIANELTGIYPFTSPGGWNIIGRTDADLWDAQRQRPALLEPGDRVRFVARDALPAIAPPAVEPAVVHEPVFRVVSAHGLATVQDCGFEGYGRIGLGRGGALDPATLTRLNVLLGNSTGAASVELIGGGITLVALRTAVFALGGSNFACTVSGVRVPAGVSWLVRAGNEIRIASAAGKGGLYALLTVEGGIEARVLLGSRSTCLSAGFGGYGGRPLAAGDLLGAAAASRSPALTAGRRAVVPFVAVGNAPLTLRYVPYGGPQSAEEGALKHFEEQEWTVSAESSRMGSRLQPGVSAIPQQAPREIASFGLVRGAIQLPPDGRPMLLNADYQSTGGYPLIGVVISADYPAMSRLFPGTRVRFVRVSVEEARRASG